MNRRSVTVRPARESETDAVTALLDAAMLTVPDDLAARVARGDALVAVDPDGGGTDGTTDGTTDDTTDERRDRALIGALVLDGGHVDAVAVRKPRRADGVGTALVAAAAERTDGALTATFREQVRPFYESLGFEIEGRDGRLFGRLADDSADDPVDPSDDVTPT